MINDYLFVYGTLRRCIGGEISELLATNADFIDYACYCGRLYQADGYPGVVPSDNPEHIVHGEVYLLPDAKWLLACLDRYEGYGPEFPEPNEYRRQKQEVSLNNGSTVSAWVYLYNHSTIGLKLIESVNSPLMQEANGGKPGTSCFPDGDRFARPDDLSL